MKHALALGVIALAAAGCGAGGHAVTSPMPGTVPSTPGDKAIARIQADVGEGSIFNIFPNGQTRTGCLIPGKSGFPIKGTCETRVSHELRHGGRSVTIVTFTEFWPARKFRTHGPPTGTLHHSWSYEIRANGRIVSGGSEGNFPPQSAI